MVVVSVRVAAGRGGVVFCFEGLLSQWYSIRSGCHDGYLVLEAVVLKLYSR